MAPARPTTSSVPPPDRAGPSHVYRRHQMHLQIPPGEGTKAQPARTKENRGYQQKENPPLLP
ncbi:hypothetical protein [Capillibacterium thermochitinicola]|uniref:Uncharacterized protein n=1 Tax=Capillibacterium thermochitinicola TaxID=2699427 RepID=A0A8J6I195_9FIRM|nr:hypothetical protein [Capillibacterium thermochitinicola]MBA2133133.1 hypothetical protein [Capillibacterium thermochitinicola]